MPQQHLKHPIAITTRVSSSERAVIDAVCAIEDVSITKFARRAIVAAAVAELQTSDRAKAE